MSRETEFLENMANVLRLHALRMTAGAASGHATSCLSAAEIMSVLWFSELRYDPGNMDSLDNDELVLSKGHAAPLLYAALAEVGALPREQLQGLRTFASTLEGHPVPRVPGVRVATGALGQGLSIGMGMAHAIQLDGGPQRVYVLLGDGEMAEGNVWEALNFAPRLGLRNLCAILDMNRLGQSGPTLLGWDSEAYLRRVSSFGWRALAVDGHAVEGLLQTFQEARGAEQPVFVVARTVKGKGVSFLEDAEGWHGQPVPPERLSEAVAEVEGKLRPVERIQPKLIQARTGAPVPPTCCIQPSYTLGQDVATRTAYGHALLALGEQDPSVVVLDADVKNSTRTQQFFDAYPERSIECFIAEQNMAGLALGLQARGKRPCAATFATFWTRAHDQLRMGSYSLADLKLAGSHAGVAIGEDGPSQMGLEDIALFRSLLGAVVLSPADAVAAEKLTVAAANHRGISYLRLGRSSTPVIYPNEEEFPIGSSKVLRRSEQDVATIVATGVTVAEALAAAGQLAEQGVHVRVIDCYSLQPVDRETLRAAARETGLLVTAEDHYLAGGLGETVALAVAGLAPVHALVVTKMPHSGPGKELLAEQGLDAAGIRQKVEQALAR